MSGATPKSVAQQSTNRTRSNRSRAKGKGNNFVTKREVKGGQIHVSSNPPDITYQPWYPCTVVHMGATSDLHITVDDLVKELAGQLDPFHHAFHGTLGDGSTVRCLVDQKNATAPRINLRLQSVRAWNLTGRIISLSVDDFSDISKAIGDADSLCGLVDTGSSTHVPAVGYELPLSHRNIVLRNSSTEGSAQLYHVMAPSSDTFIVYTNVLWRCDGPSKLASGFEDKMLSVMKRISNLSKTVSENTASLHKNSNVGIAADVRYIADHLPNKCNLVSNLGDRDFVDSIRRFNQFTAFLEKTVDDKDSSTGSRESTSEPFDVLDAVP